MQWLLKLFKSKRNVKCSTKTELNTEAEVCYRSDKGWTSSIKSETTFFNVGGQVRHELISIECVGDVGTIVVSGPSAGLKLKAKGGASKIKVAALAELSAVKVEGELPVTKNVALYGSANLNCNTGIKLGSTGCQVNMLGWGVTLGIGGKWTFDSSFGSLGASSEPIPIPIPNYSYSAENSIYTLQN